VLLFDRFLNWYDQPTLENVEIILEIVKKFNQIEQNEKSQQEAELQFSMQRDIEKEKLTNYEMLTINYLTPNGRKLMNQFNDEQ
jgi:hypothetical protein